MKTYLKITLVLATGLALITLLHLVLTASAAETPAPSHTAAPAPLRTAGNVGGDFRFALSEPNNLDPADYYPPNTTHGPIIGQVFEGLTKWGDDLEPLPAIAQSWESSDAQHWTFHIRPDARFHNGRQVTAQDVLYSWNRVATEGNEWYDGLMAPMFSTITVVCSDTLQVTLYEPYAPFPSLLALPFMSVVPSETVGTVYTNPVGSGPFQFQSWTEGDSIALTHYDDYYDGRPYLDSITYQFYLSEAYMYADYLLGNLDLSPVPGDRITEVVGSPNAIFMNTLGLYYYGMKVDRPPFDDVRVRRALNYAGDRWIEPGFYWSNGPCLLVAAEGPVPPGMQGYDPPVPSYTYSPTLALDLLAQAGWTDTNSDGILDDGAGTDLTIELWYNTDPGHQVIAEFIGQSWRDIGGTGLGATVVVSHTDWSTYFDNLDQYPMYRLDWIASYPDPYNFLEPLFHSRGPFIFNYTNYSNAQVDNWLGQSRATLDLTTRQALYENVEKQVQDDAPIINLFYYGAVYIQGEDALGLVIPRWGLDGIQMEKVQLFLHEHDVEVASILYPKESVLAGEPITPVIKVRNAGSSDETNVPVRCRILQDGTEVYSEIQIIPSLCGWCADYPDANNWVFESAAGDYTIECTTLLPSDEDPSNDQKTRDFTVTEDAFYDAYIRDGPTDDGSVCTDRSWQSPDIIVRNQDDNIRRSQDPILGQINYVYVKVRNIGNAAISDGYVNVYWNAPSPGIRCGSWLPINPAPVPVGTLRPGESKWVKIPWVPPVAGHTCFYVEFSSPDDPATFECDVACDNNLATRNVEVVDLEGEGGSNRMRALAETGQASVVFEVSNVYDLPALVDLIVERGTFPTTGTLTLEFSNDLFSRWQAAGGTVEGGAVIPGTTRISVTHPVSATVAGLPMGVREMQQARMYLTGPPGAEFALHVTERIHGTIIGGITYRTEIPWSIYLPVVLRDYSGGS